MTDSFVMRVYGIFHAAEYTVFNIRCMYINVCFRELREQRMLKVDEN
jgi:hypothetical protein